MYFSLSYSSLRFVMAFYLFFGISTYLDSNSKALIRLPENDRPNRPLPDVIYNGLAGLYRSFLHLYRSITAEVMK